MMTTNNPAARHDRAAEILGRAKRLCEPVLRESVEALPDPMRRMAGYHFGWWDAVGAPTLAESGKALRPALTLAAAVTLGSSEAVAVRAAAAVELVHNFTLLHDDVMDVDQLRRGRPAVWKVWGVSDAMLVGNVLHAQASRVLIGCLPAGLAADAIGRLAAAVVEMCRGQHEDCAFDQDRPVTVESYVRMAMGKTGALMGCACALGALCADADEATVAAMDAFGRQLGLAFQFVDDLIGIWGDPLVTGKPTNDLARRTLSLPVVVALASGDDAAGELARMYQSATPMDAARATTLVEDAGGRRGAQRLADDRVRAAIDALPDLSKAPDLLALAQLVGSRDR